MSQGTTPFDDLPSSDVTLQEPEIADAPDAAGARNVVDDRPQSVDVGARTQQGQMKTDVAATTARVARRMRREEATDDRINERVQRFLKTEADGFLQVTRLGPVEMPSIELGVVGQVRHAQLASMTISEVLLGMVGGGMFQVAAYRGDNTPVEGDVYTIQVVGDPKPKTRAGKVWLERANKEGTLTEPAPRGDGENNGSMMQFIMQMMDRDKERDRIRAEADEQRRRHDAEKEARDFRERQDELKAARDKEMADLKAARERDKEEARDQRERDREEANARRENEGLALKARIDAQIAQMGNEAAARLKQMELDAELERDRRKMLLDAEARRIEAKDTGGLGFEGLVKVREQIAEAVAKATLKSAGLDEEEESPGMGGAIAEVLRSEGPELLRSAAAIFLPKIAAWLPGGAASAPAPQQVVPTPRPQLPMPQPGAVPDFSTATPRQETAPEEPEHADVPDVEQSAPQQIVGTPTKEVTGRAAANYALQSVFQFIRPLTVLAVAQPEPQAAWDVVVGSNGETLADLYRQMPRPVRERVATDWGDFVKAVRDASPADADRFDEAIAEDGGSDWLKQFLASGPWVPEETTVQ